MSKQRKTDNKVRELKAQKAADFERQLMELQNPVAKPNGKVLKKVKGTASAVGLGKSPSAAKGKF